MFSPSEDKLRLDIGISKDVLRYKAGDETISFGADLFTYTRLRSEGKFKFPVETIDYFFGINGGYKKYIGINEFGVRFRLSHISAHLVDGKYIKSQNEWSEGRRPIVYSKEFIEIFPYYNFTSLRMYLGLTYIFHTIPKIIKKGIYQAGFDSFIIPFRIGYATPFIAYDFKLTGIEDVYSGNNIIKAGFKFGNPYAKGFSVVLSYISGKSIHGELYDLSENYFNLGFNLEL